MHIRTRLIQGAVTALAAGGGLMAMTVFALQNTDKLIERGFKTALNSQEFVRQASNNEISKPVSGSEEFWLSAMQAKDGIPALQRTVSIGDKLTMSIGGKETVYAVTSVAELPAEVTYVDTRPLSLHYVLVTARDINDPSGKELRFVVEATPDQAPTVAGRPAQAL